jgi:ATP-dependent Clp protease ATP-binding subunit ClpA
MAEKPKYNTAQIDKLLRSAAESALSLNHEYVTIDHVVRACMSDQAVIDMLKSIDVDINGFAREFRDYVKNNTYSELKKGQTPRPTETVNQAVYKTSANMMFSGRTDITGSDLILAIMELEECWPAYFLANNGLDVTRLKDKLTADYDPTASDQSDEHANISPEKAKKFLEKYCTNLNAEAFRNRIDPLIGRETEVYNIVKILSRRKKANVITVGDPGVGKTAIVEGLARLIVEDRVPEVLRGHTIWALDIAGLVAGSKFRGDFEERMKMIMIALQKVEKPILFIDEIHMIMGAGAAGKADSMDAANMLKPALASGQLKCIGSTTLEEYREYFEKDKALMRRFQKLDIFEPSVEDSKRILSAAKGVYEKFHGITYDDDAIRLAVELTARYVTNRFLPDKAFDIIDSAGATQRVAKPDEKVTVVTGELIENEVALIAKIPAQTVKETEVEKLSRLNSDIKAKLFGQDTAVDTLTDAVLMSRAGLRAPNKPAGVYLLRGPTGVGKTEATKQLSSILGVELIRYDMSEYMEVHSISKLIGSPPGYVGYGDGAAGSGKLITDIETHPYCVLLLDEVEKAHPDVWNLFLQVFDNGRLTSSDGKVVNFENVIVVLTTNVGARESAKLAIGFGSQDRNAKDDTELKRYFSPEFLNRLDAIVNFNSLGKKDIIHVVDKFINDLGVLASAKGVTIHATLDAKNWLADKGFDKEMGARPMDRTIAEYVKKPLSKAMLFGELKNGGTVTVGVVDNAIKLMYGDLPDIKMPELAEAEM